MSIYQYDTDMDKEVDRWYKSYTEAAENHTRYEEATKALILYLVKHDHTNFCITHPVAAIRETTKELLRERAERIHK